MITIIIIILLLMIIVIKKWCESNSSPDDFLDSCICF
jgi:hypothetical protein